VSTPEEPREERIPPTPAKDPGGNGDGEDEDDGSKVDPVDDGTASPLDQPPEDW
jgi:hypothetical protein